MNVCKSFKHTPYIKYLKQRFLNSICITYFFLAGTAESYGQSASKSAIVIYQQTLDLHNFVIRKDTLRIVNNRSIFDWALYQPANKELQRLAEKWGGKPEDYDDGGYISGQMTIIDMQADSIYSVARFREFDRELFISEPRPEIEWTISDSTKMLGNYQVQKATAPFRGRTYTAWFAPAIALPYGPWKLHGLPGLILQAYDHTGRVQFKAIDLRFTPVPPITTDGLANGLEKIDIEEYKYIMNNFRKLNMQALVRETRQNVSAEEMRNMKFELYGAHLLETFGGPISYDE